jgi:hypothetical protein
MAGNEFVKMVEVTADCWAFDQGLRASVTSTEVVNLIFTISSGPPDEWQVILPEVFPRK